MRGLALFFNAAMSAIIAAPACAADDEIIGVQWGRNAYNFESMPSGPQPIKNLSRNARGVANSSELVGDYHNPILTPEAAAALEKKGELAKAGGFPSAEDQCRPLAPPFSSAVQFDFQILQKKDGDLTILGHQDDQVRHVRMNGTHPAKLVATAMGDSIAHWDGDTLVIDTVGVRTDAFIASDRLGTPQSELMHVVERYRLIDGARAAADIEAYEKTDGMIGGRPPDGYMSHDLKRKGLRLEITMEDPKTFNQPLTAVVTYRPLTVGWREAVCADNPVEHYKGEWVGLPTAARLDF
jgi:hypothetical protein